MRKKAAERVTVCIKAHLQACRNRCSNTPLGAASPRPSFSAASRLLLTVTVIGLLGTVSAQNKSYQQDPKWQVPADAMAKSNPLAQKPEATAGGKKLFLRNCVECHGAAGTGLEKKHAADLQLAAVQQQSDGALFWKITNGNTDHGMPSFSRLPELQRWQLVLYLRTLKPMADSQQKSSAK